MDNIFLIFVVVGFLAVVLLIEGGYLLWNSYRGTEALRIQHRLQALSAGGYLSAESEFVKERLLGKSPAVERLLLRIPRVHQLDRLLLQSGLRLTVSNFLGISAGAAFAGLVLWLFLPLPVWIAPLCVGGAAAVPSIYVLRKRRIRLHAIEQQLPDALELMSRALRAGYAFPSAVHMAGTEVPEPIAREFRIAFDEINYGVPMQDALMNLAARVPVTDLRFFVIAVSIQRETGGNLAELLDKLASLIRARFKLLGTVRVLATEGRVSAWILSILPLVLVAVLNLINPKFMSVLWTDPAGIITIWLGLSFMVVGIIWMWRIVKIRV
jgi:tight adherence protein B